MPNPELLTSLVEGVDLNKRGDFLVPKAGGLKSPALVLHKGEARARVQYFR
jgi:hypothetical protein